MHQDAPRAPGRDAAPLAERRVFQGARRDGIDATGGFKDGTVRGCIFRRNGAGGAGGGMDLRELVEAEPLEGDLHPNVRVSNVRIERCEFIDLPNATVVTLVDRADALSGAVVLR